MTIHVNETPYSQTLPAIMTGHLSNVKTVLTSIDKVQAGDAILHGDNVFKVDEVHEQREAHPNWQVKYKDVVWQKITCSSPKFVATPNVKFPQLVFNGLKCAVAKDAEQMEALTSKSYRAVTME